MDNTTSRRKFVQQTGLLAGGLVAAPLLSNANFFQALPVL
ncbi:twin-arginine translocation signal domain-containing protein [Niabella hibiscisoli]|nr:twin-arginine translocation signal domain-containing protein [Niabella hibiscisoli]MCH5718250.1 twin-arginine translocation signal domain-containing protein [Niabella hibiscisoli]